MNLLFDTNILVHITKDSKRNLYNITNPKKLQVFVSIATLGEIRSIALQNNWGEKRLETLNAILDDTTFIEINESLLETYVQIDSFSQKRNPLIKVYQFDTSRNMGKNDLWIASTAALLGLTLVTTDADFDHLHDVFLDILRITPETLLP